MLLLLGMQSTHSLPSLPGSLWPGVVAPDRVLSMRNRIKLHSYAKLNCLKWNCFKILLYIDLRPGRAVKIGNAPM